LGFGIGIGVSFHAASFCSGDTAEVFERDSGETGEENAPLVAVKYRFTSWRARHGSICSSNIRKYPP